MRRRSKYCAVPVLLAASAAIAVAAGSSSYVTSRSIIAPEYGAAPPLKGETRTNTATGATIRRQSDYRELSPATAYSLVVYSRFSPTNSSEQYVLAFGDDSYSSHVYRIADAVKVASLTRDGIHGIGEDNEVRWDYSGSFPTRVYFRNGTGLYQMDVLTGNGAPTLVHDFSREFPTAALVWNRSEGDSSRDSRYWAFMIAAPYDGSIFPIMEIITYDRQTDAILGHLRPADVGYTTYLPTPNMVDISPLGSRVIVSYDRAYAGNREGDIGTVLDGTHAFDLDFTNPAKVAISATHSGWAFDANGREWFVSQNDRTDWIEARDILTGAAMDILYHGDLGWGNGFHFGRFYDPSMRGWFMMSTYSTTSTSWGENQIMMVALQPAAQNPTVWRIIPSYNLYDGFYRDEAPVALSHDGKSVWWTANWGTANGHGEVYRTELPADWLAHFGGGTADTTPPSVTQFAIPATSSSLTVPITAFTATDDVAVTGFAATESATPPAAGSLLWSPVPPAGYTFASAGPKTLYGWAIDAAGNTASRSATVTIALPDTIAPTVAITDPVAGATVTGIISVSVAASDDVGVTRIELYVDGALAGADSSAPYSITWDTRPAADGSHSLTARAYDAAGNSGESAPVPVTVDNPLTTIALVQSRSAEDYAVRSLTLDFPSFNTAGDLLIVFVRMQSTSQSVAISDSAGNSYTHAVAQVQSRDNSQVHMFYASNARAGANTVTARFSARNRHPWLAIFEFRGVSALDRTGQAQGFGSSPSCGTTVSTTQPELVFAGVGLRSASDAIVGAGAGYTLLEQDSIQYGSRGATEALVSSSAGTFTGAFTLSRNTYWSCVSASFR